MELGVDTEALEALGRKLQEAAATIAEAGAPGDIGDALRSVREVSDELPEWTAEAQRTVHRFAEALGV